MIKKPRRKKPRRHRNSFLWGAVYVYGVPVPQRPHRYRTGIVLESTTGRPLRSGELVSTEAEARQMAAELLALADRLGRRVES